jgi:AraC-like DNA-binding protein
MSALRIPESVLRSRIRSPSRFCALEFDARSGIAKLFIDYLNLISASPHLHPGDVQSLVSAQLVDLLVAVLEQDHRVLQSASSSIRNAHLVRIEQYIIKNLYDPDLSAERIAAACNISVRYLHLLFADTGETLARWIRDRRLQLAYEKIVSTKSRASICQLAYAHGFNDHAQFSSAFRKKYGCSPKSVLGSARASEDT